MPPRKSQAPACTAASQGYDAAVARLLVLFALIGCTPTVYSSLSHRDLRPAASLAPARVDVQASEVVLDAEGFGGGVSGDEVRTAVANALQEYLGGGPGAPAARFRLVGRTSVTGAAVFWLVPCFVDLVFVGCPLNSQSAHVDLTLEIRDRQYTGSGDAWTLGGLYYNHNTRGVLGRATAQALQEIFEKAGGAR